MLISIVLHLSITKPIILINAYNLTIHIFLGYYQLIFKLTHQPLYITYPTLWFQFCFNFNPYVFFFF